MQFAIVGSMAKAVDTSPLPLMKRIRAEGSDGAIGTKSKRPRLQEATEEPAITSPPTRRRVPQALRTHCALKSCSGVIFPNTEQYVEVQTGLPERNLSAFLKKCAVNWRKQGEATFHEPCWKAALKSARARNQKKATVKLSFEEKVLIKEAAKTVEFHDSFQQVIKEGARIATLLKNSKHCIVFTGAGISTSAGIGDYRGKGGKWTELDREVVTLMVAESLAQSEETGGPSDNGGTEEEGVPYEKLRPTYVHEALVKLLEMGLVKHIVSQNGDGLHGLSGVLPENLSELHGNVFLEICEKCGYRYYRPFYVMDDHASLYYEELSDNGETDIIKPKHAKQCSLCGLNHRTGRKCNQKGCHGYLKDSIINFRDNLEEAILNNAERHAQQADLCLSLGTTMQVTPACELVEMGKQPLRLVVINRQKTGFDDLCYHKDGGQQMGARVFGDCDQVMRELMRNLLSVEERAIWEKQGEERLKVYDSLRQT